MSLFKRVIIIFTMFAALLLYFFQKFLFSPLPVLEVSSVVAGLSGPVQISRDEYGLTYIHGEYDKDVYFATGYVHAQDRLWQLEIQRRLARGTLSELFGKSTVDADIWIRTLGLYRAAEKSLPVLSKKAVMSLEAYSAGVNAWIKSTQSLPIEFSMFGVNPEPWTPVDSLAWIKMFALNLSGNLRGELQRQLSLKYLPIELAQIFFPDIYTSNQNPESVSSNVSYSTASSLLALTSSFARDFHVGGRNVGSNAWVVSGEHTASGAPILANDPHLGLQIPSLWYGVNQEGSQIDVSGMTLVGLPIIIFGKNSAIAWGGTNMMADVQDLYQEQINPQNPNQYWIDNHWQTFQIRKEKIHVRADFPSPLRNKLKPIEIVIRETHRGPLVSDVIKSAESPMSLAWVALREADTTYEAFFRLNYASNWEEFSDAMAYHIAPVLNMFYADVNNNIGYRGVGKIPLRRLGDGTLPLLISETINEWDGYIPYSEMPQEYNPKSGFLLNANNENVDDGYPYMISHEFASSARAKRIQEIIEDSIATDTKITVSATLKAQGDTKDLSVHTLLNVFQSVKVFNERQIEAQKYIRQWRGSADKDSVGATLFYSWLRHLRIKLFEDELSVIWNKGGDEEYLSTLSKLVEPDKLSELIRTDSPWCDETFSEEVETCSDILLESLDDMLREMSYLLGDNIEEWMWGNAQESLYKHTPFSRVKVLDSIFERRIAAGGSINTINVAAGYYEEFEGYLKVSGAGFRQVMMMSEKHPEHWFMNSTGQSGQVSSPFYDNMVQLFNQQQSISFNKNNINATSTLMPGIETKRYQ